MSEKIIYWEEVDSCEHCPGGIKENYGKFRCKHDTEITFQQNRDMGVPAACPKRGGPPT
jgi:hypothetical protein